MLQREELLKSMRNVNYQPTKNLLASHFVDESTYQLYSLLPNVLAIHIGTSKRIPHICLTTSPWASIRAVPALQIYLSDQRKCLNISRTQLAYNHWTKDPVVLRSNYKYSMSDLTEIRFINNTRFQIDHYYNTVNCYNLVKQYCEKFCISSKKIHNIENYQFENAVEWALGPMLKNNKFEHGYSVLSINNQPWSFGGIKKYDNDTALIMSRHFSFFTIYPVTHGLLIPFQLNLSKQLGYKKAWITLNKCNERLYD
ncbi:MAG: hypothetical protein N2235_23105, partial [Fischerella sp.]|nr:hypothetical protein [Fischerella sp.]